MADIESEEELEEVIDLYREAADEMSWFADVIEQAYEEHGFSDEYNVVVKAAMKEKAEERGGRLALIELGL